MKNLKKILALVLAFACAFTMFAGAAFTDQADINADNADAVELLTTLNIISGYPDGTFDPEGTVDRAEMAKMIYTIRNGGNDDASAHVDNTTSFTDINGHWAEGYIKYLQNTGIVAGKSATTFDPDSPVTTTEAMKMALALAGYDEKNAELTGPNWSKNTLTYATTIGLTDDVNSAMSAGCSRQDAAQILANVLEANAVRYSAIVENFVNDSKTGLSYGGDPITVGNKWMDLTVYVGMLVSSGDLVVNDIDGAAANAAGANRFRVDVETIDNMTYNPQGGNTLMLFRDNLDHTDLVGQEVKVLTGEEIDEVFGVYATETSNVVETTMDQIDVTSNNELEIGDVTYDTKDAEVYVDLGKASNGTTNLDETFDGVFGDEGRVAADNVKIIDWDDDGDYETILVNTVTVAKVNSVTDSALTVGSIGSRDEDVFGNTRTIDLDDNNVADDIAKDDYVAITKNDYDDSWNVVAVGTVEGTVNGLVQNERRIRVDGEWYTLANDKTGAQDNDSDLYVVPGGRDTFTNGDSIVMYTIGNTVYFADSSTGNDANRSVLMVYDVQSNPNIWGETNQVKAIFADGEKETITLDLDATGADVTDLTHDADEDTYGDLDIGRMYRYTVNNDDEYALFELSNVDDRARAGYDEYVDNTNGAVNGSRVQDYMIADDAVVFALIGNNDAAVYSGKTIKNADQTGWQNIPFGGVLVEETNGIDYARMLNIVLDDELSESNNYAYLLSDAVRSQDDAQYIEYHLWTGSEIIDVRERTNDNRETYLLKGDVITYENDGEGLIRSVEEVYDNGDGMAAAIRGYYNGDLRLLNANGVDSAYEVTSDTIVIYVNTNNSDDAVGVSGDGYDYPASPVDAGVDNWYANAVWTEDNDGGIEFILIDINGNLDDTVVRGNASSWTGTAAQAAAANLQTIVNTYRNVTIEGNVTLDDALTIPTVHEVTVNGNLDLAGETLTANGQLTVTGTCSLKGGTLTGAGSADVNVLDMGSTISGSIRVTANSAVLSGNMEITGTAVVNIAGNITGGATYTLTISGGTVTAQNVTGNLTVSGTASVDVADVTGDVTVSGSADVAMGDVTGNVTNNGTGNVTADKIDGEVSGDGDVDYTLTVAQVMNAALEYEYDPTYNYTGKFGVDESGNVTYTTSAANYTTNEVDGADGTKIKVATADLARFVGAVYRFDNGNSVSQITYGDEVYNWNPEVAGNLKGSNWVNANNETLVSVVSAYIATQSGSLTEGVDLSFIINGVPVTMTLQATE